MERWLHDKYEGKPLTMTFEEKSLYHQVHPLKLATDIGCEPLSLYFFSRHDLVLGLGDTFCSTNRSFSGLNSLWRSRSHQEVKNRVVLTAPHDQDDRGDSACRRHRDGSRRLVSPAFTDHQGLGCHCCRVVQWAAPESVANEAIAGPHCGWVGEMGA